MKHIKKLNEYQRTVGFRYSQPKEQFSIKLYLDGELTKEQIATSLKEIDVVFNDIEFIDIEDEDDVESEVMSVVTFEINIYNEKELEKILEDFSKIINLDYDVRTLEVFAKPKRVSKNLNESKKEFDVQFFQDAFQDLIDAGAEFEYLEGTFFEVLIEISTIKGGISNKYDPTKKIEDYLKKVNKIQKTMSELELAIQRIKSEYADVISIKVEETWAISENWAILITIEPEE